MSREQEIEAREKAAPLSEFEIEQWRRLLDTLMHDASPKTEIRWEQELRALATIDVLLDELREAREKLEVVEELRGLALGQTPLCYTDWLWLHGRLDRIPKGGE